jgi:hypothetical protein
VQRWSTVVALATCAVLGAACGGGSPSKADQGRSIAEQAGLPKDVADFFALASAGVDATYRVTVDSVDTDGKPLQVTATQRPPDARVDTFHADGTIDTTLATGGRNYQCTMTSNHWECGEIGTSGTSGGVFSPETIRKAIDGFEQRANDYDFRVEHRSLVGVDASCLVTTRKPGRESESALGAEATMCVSPEGVVLLVDVPTGSITATAYTTTIPADAFTLPAPVETTTVPSSSSPN